MVELGISTFGETTVLEGTGQIYSHAERIRQLVAEIELADKVGLDVYGYSNIDFHQKDKTFPLTICRATFSKIHNHI